MADTIVRVVDGTTRVIVSGSELLQPMVSAAAASAAAAADSAAEAAESASSGGIAAVSALVKGSVPSQRNIFDKNAITSDVLIVAASGAAGSIVYGYATDFMAVAPGQSIVLSHASVGNSGYGYAWYNANKEFISGSGAAVAANSPITVPDGAYFLRMSFQTGNPDPAKLMVITGATLPTSYRGFNLPDLQPTLKAAWQSADRRHVLKKNMYDADRVVAGVLPLSGGGEQNIPTYSMTGYIPVIPGEQFKTYPASHPGITGTFELRWLDKDYVRVGGTPFPLTNGQTHTPPAEAAYVTFPFKDEDKHNIIVLPAAVTPGIAMSHRPAMVTDAKQWAGRRIAHSGDSLSDLIDLPEKLAASLGATLAGKSDWTGKFAVPDIIKSAVTGLDFTTQEIQQFDIFTIWLGSNDSVGGQTLGTINDATTADTFFGHYKRAIQTLLTAKPSLVIGLSTMAYHHGTTGTEPWNSFQAAIRTIADYYNLPLLELEATGGVNPFNTGTLQYDGRHWTDEGAKVVLGRWKAFYNSLYPNDAV
jgi:hypothetical protein